MELKNKVVWITGASSGIGEALSYAFAKEGCKLVISARRESELQRVKTSTNLTDDSILILPLDLENHVAAPEWVSIILAKFGRIDVLVNNGGLSQKGTAMQTTTEVERKIMEINYFGNIALTKAVIPVMQKQQSGHLVVTTSILGKFGLPFHTTYAASKHALYGYYDSLRMELKPFNINVLLVAPGFINTNASINSLNADGSISNQDSPAQMNGMKTGVFAKKLISALKRNKQHIYIGNKELLAIPFKMLLPKLFYTIMDKMSKGK
ncbi:MAG: SDR family oxidoreductase [Bacteroidetes bacterium]|nr:SDR family oxidoreductase [Bacteroidota bacterium]